MTSLYIDSILLLYVLLLLAVFVNCCSKPALAFALLLFKIVIITVMKITMLTIKPVANKLMDIVHTTCTSVYTNRIDDVACDVSTDHSLNSKDTPAIIGWYVSTGDIVVAGGSGAAATV